MANHASVAILFVVSAVSFFLVLVESTARAQLQQRQTSVTSALPAPDDGTFQEMEGRKFNFNYPWHHKQQAEVSSNSVDSDAEARFFGNVVNSYLKFAQKFDTSNPFRKIQKYGLSNFLAYRAATMNRAFNSAWYRAKSYYYAAQSGATSLLGSLPESTRERLFSRLVQDGIPYVMNATGVFAPSAVEWAVDTGNKMLDVYKRERQAERRHAMATKHGVEGVTSTEASERYRQARESNPVREAIQHYFQQKFSPSSNDYYYYADDTDDSSAAAASNYDTDTFDSDGALLSTMIPKTAMTIFNFLQSTKNDEKKNNPTKIDNSGYKKSANTDVSEYDSSDANVNRQGEADEDDDSAISRLSAFFDPYTVLAGVAFATYVGVLFYLAAVPPSSTTSTSLLPSVDGTGQLMSLVGLKKSTRTAPELGVDIAAAAVGNSPAAGFQNFMMTTNGENWMGQQGNLVLIGKILDVEQLKEAATSRSKRSPSWTKRRHMERRPRRRLHNMDMKNPGRSDNYKENSAK